MTTIEIRMNSLMNEIVKNQDFQVLEQLKVKLNKILKSEKENILRKRRQVQQEKRIKERFENSEKGYRYVSSLGISSEIICLHKRVEVLGSIIKINTSGVVIELDGELKNIPFHRVVV